MRRYEITNHSQAPQGFYETAGTGVVSDGVAATYIKPGDTLTVSLDAAHLKQAQALGELLTIKRVSGAEDDDGGDADVERAKVLGDGQAASEGLPAQPNMGDDFDPMTDDELKAFIKDRDGRAPHPNTSRDKLLLSARAGGAQEDV